MIAGAANAGEVFVPPQAGDGRVLWTVRPERVDPAGQNLPRVPDRRLSDPFPDLIYIPRTVRIPDSGQFVLPSGSYRIGYLDPIAANRVCKDSEGRRWACGLRARMALRRLIAGKQIACKSLTQADPGNSRRVLCRLGAGQGLAESVARSGAALAGPGSSAAVQAAVREAAAARAGVWRDQDFFAERGAALLQRRPQP